MIAPPRFTESILEALGAETNFREALLGDLTEEFVARAERDGLTLAQRWYYRESLRAVPHLLRDSLRHLRPRDVRDLAKVVITSLLCVTVLGVFANVIVLAIGIPPDLLIHSPFFGVIGLLLGCTSSMTGGFIAAWLNTKAPVVGALALGIVWSSLSLASMLVAPHGLPALYRFSVPIVAIIGTTAGGIFYTYWSRGHYRPV
jgi:hypothetical protein